MPHAGAAHSRACVGLLASGPGADVPSVRGGSRYASLPRPWRWGPRDSSARLRNLQAALRVLREPEAGVFPAAP
eukprot:8454241-Alexandrium_andersonii.AAC.1